MCGLRYGMKRKSGVTILLAIWMRSIDIDTRQIDIKRTQQYVFNI